MAGKNWSLEETTMAFVLYFQLEPGKIDARTKAIQRLGDAIGRTAGAVVMKIGNISAHDQNRINQGRTGLKHGSKLDSEIWEIYQQRGDELLTEGIELLANTLGASQDDVPEYAAIDLPVGGETLVEVTKRTNQAYFRNNLLKNYQGCCCVTGLDVPDLLVASHIKPWKVSDPKTERLAPSNGLLLNALHDKAFDQGLITIDQSFKVVVSKSVKHTEASERALWRYHGSSIQLPLLMKPAKEFIEYHNDCIFRG